MIDMKSFAGTVRSIKNVLHSDFIHECRVSLIFILRFPAELNGLTSHTKCFYNVAFEFIRDILSKRKK